MAFGDFKKKAKSKSKSKKQVAFKSKSDSAKGSRMLNKTTPFRGIMTNLKSSSPFPEQYVAKLKYVTYFTLDPGAAGTAFYKFQCNGMYDPDITSTGHQPLGFDQLMAWYNIYTVISSKINVMFTSSDATALGQAVVGIYQDDDATTPASGNFEQLLEQPTTRYAYLAPLTGGKNGQKVSYGWSARKYYGRTIGSLASDSQFAGTAAANPSSTPMYQVFAFPVDASANTAAIYCWAEISFLAMFTERKTQALN